MVSILRDNTNVFKILRRNFVIFFSIVPTIHRLKDVHVEVYCFKDQASGSFQMVNHLNNYMRQHCLIVTTKIKLKNGVIYENTNLS